MGRLQRTKNAWTDILSADHRRDGEVLDFQGKQANGKDRGIRKGIFPMERRDRLLSCLVCQMDSGKKVHNTSPVETQGLSGACVSGLDRCP